MNTEGRSDVDRRLRDDEEQEQAASSAMVRYYGLKTIIYALSPTHADEYDFTHVLPPIATLHWQTDKESIPSLGLDPNM